MQDMKLFLFYLFLIVVGGGISYFLINKVILPYQFNDYLVFLFLTVFIAMDRLIKSIVDDYIAYHKPEKNTATDEAN
ncbi:hypothetical protein COJ48_15000 [Bacillus cereus]|nr:hypothetical protein COJ48_15000 [Bacillus cereus]PGP77241.1 hypothetical protein CN997_22735 [Bacillus cereus]